MSVAEHVESLTIKDEVVTPEHEQRGAESAEFHKNVQRLKEDGHYKCYLCGILTELQTHHCQCEWSLEEDADYDELKTVCEEHDIYGYGRLLRNQPMTTVDDIRNLMVLCQDHHTGKADLTNTGTGIHNTVWNYWIMQRIAKKGKNPVPQDGETIEQVEARI